MFYSQVNFPFILIGTGSKCDQSPQSDHFIFFLDVIIIYIVIEYIIDYFVLIQTPFQVFESTTVRAIRKYKLKKNACLNLLFRRTQYHYKFGEVAVRLGIEVATIQNFCSTPSEEDRVDRRIFTPRL